ncbi:MAG TPA: hypothetical protein VMV18_05375 [bacterium]|nr:hypothetical protein [bacterium]
MSVYRVKLGDTILDVEGLSGLVSLVKEGRLGPEDPVFIPSTGRWHYARSVRQLREFFPEGLREPPPKPAREPEPPPEPEPSGEVVPLRRGRWSPEGTGVDVPVFAYEVDADAPRPVRLAAIVIAALAVGTAIAVYEVGYAWYYRDRASSMKTIALVTATPTPTPRPTAAGSRPTQAVASPTASVRATPTPLQINIAALRGQVAGVEVARVARPDQLGAAMRADLAKVAVPIHEVALTAGKGARNGAVPFQMRIDYVPVAGGTREHRVRDEYVILAMAGRRASELKLNVDSLRVRTLAGGKPVSDVVIAPALALKAWAGELTAEDVAAAFEVRPR